MEIEQSFRLRLITVPSCEEHNSHKSANDQNLMVCLAARVENNHVAFVHTNTKIKRSLQRNPDLINIHKNMTLYSANNEWPVSIINVNLDRLRSSFEAIARALYYHEFKSNISGSCISIADFF